MDFKNEKLNEFNQYLRGKKVAIIGLGVSNLPLLDYMHSLDAKVTVFDKKNFDSFSEDIIKKLNIYQIPYFFGEDALSNLIGFDIIFRSPSCRPDTKEIVDELKRGAILTSEIEMVLELCPGTVVGITGSDGKTTTTSLIYEIIKKEGYNCYLGGNIGTPLFSKLPEMRPEDIVVLELSSFQLMNMKISPHIAVITNISPNHLDIHKSYEEYIECKKNIFKYQKEDDILILNKDNDITASFGKEAPGKVVYFSSKQKIDDGIIYDNGIIKECEDSLRKHILNTKDVILRGVHNYENICAAIAATKTLANIDTIKNAVSLFKGVEHRLEFVRDINGVKWYNDSIGTSPTRTIAGLSSFEEPIILIAGGYDKHLDYTPIAKPIIQHVRSLILLGATAQKIKDAVEEELNREDKEMDIYVCNTLEETVNIANQIAKKGDVVLFSPASASFDMFKNFAERGNKFKEIVLDL